MSFKKLGLSKTILQAIEEKGYTEPSPIQEKAIPHVLDRKDLLASAQTGTGKTAAFCLPLLQLLGTPDRSRKRRIKALILTPTRELAAQVFQEVKDYSKYTGHKSAVIFGGVNQNPQVQTLNQGVDILIATPGRLLDLVNQGYCSLSSVEVLILDEADRMLDMGFLRDIKKVLSLVPEKKQSLLFSATFSAQIKGLASQFLNNPVRVEATPENTTVEKIEQYAHFVDKAKKPIFITKLISEGEWSQVLIFTRTKHGADKLTKKLMQADISAAAIHGNKSQGARTRALANFKSGDIRVLVATDIAARGLDIPLLPHVVNFELPNQAEDYVHRIGRTGRAGAKGEAISLVSPDETSYLRDIEKLTKSPLKMRDAIGFEPDPNASTEKPKQGGGRGRRPQQNSRNKGSKKPSSKSSRPRRY